VRETEEKKSLRIRGHGVTLENRERAVFSGVEDVESFNEDEVVLVTEAGVIALLGQGLHISKLNLEEGQLVVDGYILALEYEQERQQKQSGMFSRLFK